MTTDYNPYVIIDEVTMAQVMNKLNLGRTMAEKHFPHLVEDYDRTIKQVRERAERFVGSQNKPKTIKKAYQ